MFEASISEQTRRTYVRRWNAFAAWADRHGRHSLPATPATLTLYLAALAQANPPAAVSTLYGAVAAVNRVHVESGLPRPGNDDGISLLMRGYARSHRRPVRRTQVDALRLPQLRQVVASLIETDARRIRDAALIALNASGLEPSDLAALDWADVKVDLDRARIRPVGSRRRTSLTIRDTAASRPVETLLRWHSIAASSAVPVFAATDRDGRLSSRRPHPSDIQRTIAARKHSFGLADPQEVVDALLLSDPWSARDRAMLLLGFAGAFRRTELCSLTWADLSLRDEGYVVLLRRSKTDPLGQGRYVGIPYGRSLLTCPVRAVETWRRHMHGALADRFVETMPCFVPIRRAGGVSDEPLAPASVTRIMRDRTATAGVQGHFGGRSLRAGFVTTAAELGIPIEVIAKHTRHATLDNVLRYMRVDDPLRRNAASMVGL